MAENLNLKTVDTVDTRPFKRLVMTIGELPTSFIESMTYYELLAWFVNYLETVIIPTVNNNAEAVEELQGLFVELKEYVDNYFENLDVQEEINNKLDEMTQQGVLTDIIASYVDPLFNEKMDELNEEYEQFTTTVTNEVNTLTRTTANNSMSIQTLSNRMDEFTNLPTGSTSGDAELQDIREGYDGNTYSSAGTSVRTQAGMIANDVYNEITVNYAQGGINASTGANNSYQTRIRTDIIPKNVTKIFLKTGYKLLVYLFDKDDGTYVGVWDGTQIVTAISQSVYFLPGTIYLTDLQNSYNIKIVLVHTIDNENIAPSEGSNSIFYVTFASENLEQLQQFFELATSNVKLEFERGGINVSTGEYNTYSTRIRTTNFLPSGSFAINLSGDFKYIIYLYSQNGEYLGVWNGSEIVTSVYYISEAEYSINDLANTYKIKLVMANTIDNTDISVSDGDNLSVAINNVVNNTEKINEFEKTTITPIHEKESCTIEKTVTLSQSTNTGCCVVTHGDENELWTFTVGSDDNTTTGQCSKYIINKNLSLTFKETINHNLGHVNSVSYCEATDTLICGNGSGDYELAGQIYILEGAYTKTSLNKDDCLVIDFNEYGFKPNAIWGENNFGHNDIIYVITDDSHSIYKVQLGSGTNRLDNGVIQKTTGYNGTYNILDTWEWGDIKKDYPSVVQGATYIDGKLVWGFGHNVGRIAIRCAELFNESEASFTGINYYEYNNDGDKIPCYPCGVSTLNNKILITNSGKLHIIDEKSL